MYNAIALADATPIYFTPEITPEGLAGGINPDTLDNIQKNAAVVITSPTYEGFVSDIRTIAQKVHSRGGILIVDEAHGAHLKFHNSFPVSALEMGADIVVQSFHKTLPALGQLAVLHVKGSSHIDTARLRFFLQAMQTTSPSYMLMGQLDYVLNMLWQRPEIFETYVTRLGKLRAALGEAQHVSLLGRENVGNHGIYDIDPGKLLFRLNTNQCTQRIYEILASQYRLQFEAAAGRHLIAMTSVADTDEGFQRLWGAIGSLNIKLETEPSASHETETHRHDSHINQNPPNPEYSPYHIPELEITPGRAVKQETELVPWEKAAGRIAGEVVAAYPPGIALIAPGERIPQGLPKLAPTIRVIK